jgi:VWFA-related protein
MLRRAMLLVTTLLVWLPCFAQQEPHQQASPPKVPATPTTSASTSPPTLKPPELATIFTRSDLVLVPVVVMKSGKYVAGLTRDAFRVEEDGKVRDLAVFEEIQTEKVATQAKRQIHETYTNFLAGDEQTWRLTVVVLDMLNTPWMRQREGKRQLIDFLLHSTSRDEPMALFGLNASGLHQLHPFTTDTNVLIEALQKLKLELSQEEATQPPQVFNDDPSDEQEASDEEQLMSDFMQDLNDTMVANYQRMATRQTLVGMTQLAHAFQAIPGRKTLIWASAGFPFMIDDPQSFARQGDDMQDEYEKAWRALNSANIAVYPVDLGGMEFRTKDLPSANAGMSSRQINNIRGTNGMKSALNLRYDKSMQQELTLHSFADATGGRACITVDELEKCFADAVDDSRAYYLVGYYLGNDTHPGWRKVKVKVTGDGLHTRYRSGFYLAPKAQESAALRRQELADALASPVQYTGVRLTARAMPPSVGPVASGENAAIASKKTAEFMLGVLGDSIVIDREKGNAIDLEVIALAFDSKGNSVATAAQSLATQLKPERVQKILQGGLGIPEKIDLGPGKYEVKFAVRDNLGQRLGTVSLPVEMK